MTLTVGGSFDHLSGDLPGDGDDQFNPKVGLIWNPSPEHHAFAGPRSER